VPGFQGDARIFAPLAAALPGRVLWAVDLGGGTVTEVTGRLQSVLDQAGRSEVVTGSYGGLVACGLRGLRSLAAVGTLPDRAWLQGGLTRQRRLLQRLPAGVVEAMYRHHTRRAGAADGLPVALTAALASAGLDKSTLVARLRSLETWPFAPPPDVPLLWIAGATDPQVRWTAADTHDALGPRATFTTVPGSHRPHASHPGALVGRLEGFWTTGA